MKNSTNFSQTSPLNIPEFFASFAISSDAGTQNIHLFQKLPQNTVGLF